MKKIIISLSLLILSSTLFSQKYMTRNGKIEFFSEAELEKIEAVNNQVLSVIDSENGEIAFTLVMKAFLFEKSLMQEHFNEKYVESEKFPKSKFKGNIEGFDKSKLTKEWQEFKVAGELTIHGVTKKVNEVVKLKLVDGKILCNSVFYINLDDYDVKIPSAVSSNVSKKIEIKIDMKYEEINK